MLNSRRARGVVRRAKAQEAGHVASQLVLTRDGKATIALERVSAEGLIGQVAAQSNDEGKNRIDHQRTGSPPADQRAVAAIFPAAEVEPSAPIPVRGLHAQRAGQNGGRDLRSVLSHDVHESLHESARQIRAQQLGGRSDAARGEILRAHARELPGMSDHGTHNVIRQVGPVGLEPHYILAIFRAEWPVQASLGGQQTSRAEQQSLDDFTPRRRCGSPIDVLQQLQRNRPGELPERRLVPGVSKPLEQQLVKHLGRLGDGERAFDQSHSFEESLFPRSLEHAPCGHPVSMIRNSGARGDELIVVEEVFDVGERQGKTLAYLQRRYWLAIGPQYRSARIDVEHHVEDDGVVFSVGVMPVRLPIAGMAMDFHVSPSKVVVEGDDGIAEVGAMVEAGAAGIHDLKLLSPIGQEEVRAEET